MKTWTRAHLTTVSMLWAWVASAQTFPSGGIDQFPTRSAFSVTINSVRYASVLADPATIVSRREVHTEVLSLDLSGTSGAYTLEYLAGQPAFNALAGKVPGAAIRAISSSAATLGSAGAARSRAHGARRAESRSAASISARARGSRESPG